MAIPVILPVTSIPEPTVGVPYSFIPYASNTPTSWSSTALPAGLALNTSTGEVSGTPTTEGVADFALIATNGTGASLPVTITLGIASGDGVIIAVPPNLALLGYNCIIDLADGSVDFGFSDTKKTLEIVEGDGVILYVQFKKSGVFRDLGEIADGDLEIACKEFEPENWVLLGDTHIEPEGLSGTTKTYLLYMDCTGAALQAALSNYEADKETSFESVAQIRWKAVNTTGAGPDPLPRSTRLFPIKIVRNVAP
jgi:hypothetical protein